MSDAGRAPNRAGSVYFLESRGRWMVAFTDVSGLRKVRTSPVNTCDGAKDFLAGIKDKLEPLMADVPSLERAIIDLRSRHDQAMECIARLERRIAELEARMPTVSDVVPADIREAVLARDSRVCRYCGVDCDAPTLDHVWPRGLGGSNDMANLVTACRPCNSMKHRRTPDEAGMPLLPVANIE